MNIFNFIIKGTIATYALVAWLYIAIPISIGIYCLIYALTVNFLTTLSTLFSILS